MKKIFSIIGILMLMVVVLTSCTKNNDSTNNIGDDLEPNPDDDITESIDEVDTIDKDINQEEIDSELNNLEQDLLNW